MSNPAAAATGALVLLLALALCAGPAAAASVSATQTPSVPATATASPSGTRFAFATITTLSGGLSRPHGLAVDSSGSVLIADTHSNRIMRVAAGTAIVSTLAGTGASGPAASAGLTLPYGLALDESGSVLIADHQNHRILRVAAGTGAVTTLAGTGVAGFSGDGGAATNARLTAPVGVMVDRSGNMLLSDRDNSRVRYVAAGTGIITTFAGTGVGGFSGDGGPATSAGLAGPTGLAIDSSGNVLIADMSHHRIRRVAAGTGIITTLAGTGAAGFGGDGGPATSAQLSGPNGVALDGSGNVLILDTENSRIRFIAMGTGVITTLAGTGARGFGGDNGPATSATLNVPRAMALDGSGNLFIADTDNGRIRVVSAPVRPSPTPTPTPSTSPYCALALFRLLPRTDLVGALAGTALAPGRPALLPTEAACRQACCDAAACDGYAFDASSGRQHSSGECFLYVNVSQLVPSSGYASALRESALL